LFLVGWAAGLAVASGVIYAVAAADVATNSTASDSVSWLEIVLGVVLLLLAAGSWRKRPVAGAAHELPRWTQGIDTLESGRALDLGVALSSVNPKNLALAVGAAGSLAQLGLAATDAIVAPSSSSSPACRSAGRSATTSSVATGRGLRWTSSEPG
jgi:hypothetical protein